MCDCGRKAQHGGQCGKKVPGERPFPGETATLPEHLDSGQKKFTLAELRDYDGNKNDFAYLAINGIVYDVTNVQLLKDGRHHGVTPGNDVSDLFVHNKAILNRLQVVGILE
jgi:predicted heme/steroid binding protein